MIFNTISQIANPSQSMMKSSIKGGASMDGASANNQLSRRGCCGGRGRRNDNIDICIDIDIDIDIDNNNRCGNWC
ncbi:hypothetical protein CYY_006789 [Polysphondylium violaceum]|uniref:Uncharacterized protein n=1 Tax=Polysphondylium violaceum TaxID=133409 RepID=A0A8J4PRD1_9MYCE|nr:hypothetical protein CYY_006789 [Polysphondylium violaceum]